MGPRCLPVGLGEGARRGCSGGEARGVARLEGGEGARGILEE